MCGHCRFCSGYIGWIRKQSCATCGRNGLVHECGCALNDPSHIVSRGAGGKDMDNLIPQCRKHHTEMHKLGIKSFSKKYGQDVLELAKQYGRAYRRRVSDNATGAPIS